MLMNQQSTNQVTWRSIILGILLSLPHGYFSIQTPTPTTVSLIYTVILTIFLLVLINIFIKQRAPKIAFRQGELLTVYTMLSLSVAISGHDVLQVLHPSSDMLFGLPHQKMTGEDSFCTICLLGWLSAICKFWRGFM